MSGVCMRTSEKILLIIATTFGFWQSLLWSYVFWVAYNTQYKSVTIYINRYGEMYLDFIMCVLALIMTFAGVIISVASLLRDTKQR